MHAAADGVCIYAGDEMRTYGKLVVIRHADGFVTAYADNSELNVKEGDRVRRGQVIAKSGNSGEVSSPRLHFELRKDGKPVESHAVPGSALGAAHQHSNPPSTRRSTPVMKDAAGLSRKIAGPTISSTVAIRPIGVSRSKILRCSATSGRRFIGVSV